VCLERAAQLSANASVHAYEAAWAAWGMTEDPHSNTDFQVWSLVCAPACARRHFLGSCTLHGLPGLCEALLPCDVPRHRWAFHDARRGKEGGGGRTRRGGDRGKRRAWTTASFLLRSLSCSLASPRLHRPLCSTSSQRHTCGGRRWGSLGRRAPMTLLLPPLRRTRRPRPRAMWTPSCAPCPSWDRLRPPPGSRRLSSLSQQRRRQSLPQEERGLPAFGRPCLRTRLLHGRTRVLSLATFGARSGTLRLQWQLSRHQWLLAAAPCLFLCLLKSASGLMVERMKVLQLLPCLLLMQRALGTSWTAAWHLYCSLRTVAAHTVMAVSMNPRLLETEAAAPAAVGALTRTGMLVDLPVDVGMRMGSACPARHETPRRSLQQRGRC
jgi:hypothetical protein